MKEVMEYDEKGKENNKSKYKKVNSYFSGISFRRRFSCGVFYTMKKLWIVLFAVLLISSVSAAEWDNIKNYDEETKTYDIRNSILGIPFLQLDRIADVKLLTEEHVTINHYDMPVMIWEIYNYKEYDGFLKRMNSYLNDADGEVIDVQYKYKYLNEKIGTHGEMRTGFKIYPENKTQYEYSYVEQVAGSWVDFNEKETLSQGNIKVAVYLDSEIPTNQKIELIPTLFGEKLNKWATYQLAEHYDVNDNTWTRVHSTTQAAQTFTPQNDMEIGIVSILVYTQGAEGTFYGQLRNTSDGTSSGDPNGSVVATFTNVSQGTIGGAPEWYNLTFSDNNASVCANCSYSLYLQGTGANDGNEYSWRIDSVGATYTYGDRWSGPTHALVKTAGSDGMFRTFNFSAGPADTSPQFSGWNLVNNSNYSTHNLNVNATWWDNSNLTNVSVYIGGVINQTNSSQINNSLYDFDLVLPDGTHLIYLTGVDNASQSNSTATRYVNIDTTNPSLNVTSPHGNIYHISGNNIDLDWNYSDANPGVCRYEYQGTNTTITCTANTTTFAVTDVNNVTLTFYSNDSGGNTNHSVVTWNYSLWEHDRGVRNATLEGATELYYLDATILSGSLSTGTLWYDGNNTASQFTTISGRRYNISLDSFVVPPTNANRVVNLFWQVNYGTTEVNTTTSTQHINAFDIDNCTTNAVVIYNFTIVDEGTRLNLSGTGHNTHAEVELNITNYAGSQEVATYNVTQDQINPFQICVNDTFGASQFNIDTLVLYTADAYETEYYNFQNETLNASVLHQNITLYDLNSTIAEEFVLIVRDASYLAIDEALVEIWRKYVGLNEFYIVELPMTDENGETIGHLVSEDVIYRFIIKRFGETLSTFDNVKAVCQTPTLETCVIDFNAFATGIDIPDYEEGEDFNFTIDYNDVTRVVQSVFSIPSGNASVVVLNVTTADALMTSVCTDTLTSSTGTLTCTIPNTFGNSSVVVDLYKDEQLQAQGGVKLDQEPSDIYGVIMVSLGLFIMLTLIGAGVSNNPIFSIIFFMVGVILLFALNLVSNNGFIGATATILWLIVAIILVIIKGANRD